MTTLWPWLDNPHEYRFLEAILLGTCRERETLQLAYADWLEEQGDVRAEYLRVRLEQARFQHVYLSGKIMASAANPPFEALHQRALDWERAYAPQFRDWTYQAGLITAITDDTHSLVTDRIIDLAWAVDWIIEEQPRLVEMGDWHSWHKQGATQPFFYRAGQGVNLIHFARWNNRWPPTHPLILVTERQVRLLRYLSSSPLEAAQASYRTAWGKLYDAGLTEIRTLPESVLRTLNRSAQMLSLQGHRGTARRPETSGRATVPPPARNAERSALEGQLMNFRGTQDVVVGQTGPWDERIGPGAPLRRVEDIDGRVFYYRATEGTPPDAIALERPDPTGTLRVQIPNSPLTEQAQLGEVPTARTNSVPGWYGLPDDDQEELVDAVASALGGVVGSAPQSLLTPWAQFLASGPSELMEEFRRLMQALPREERQRVQRELSQREVEQAEEGLTATLHSILRQEPPAPEEEPPLDPDSTMFRSSHDVNLDLLRIQSVLGSICEGLGVGPPPVRPATEEDSGDDDSFWHDLELEEDNEDDDP